MPADPTLDPALLTTIKRLARAKEKEGITVAHLCGACADDDAQVVRHMAALVSDKALIQAGETLFAPGFEPQ